jgi:hypothetical protein
VQESGSLFEFDDKYLRWPLATINESATQFAVEPHAVRSRD